jgi:exopolysaccharide/PEP-CTERM locus tyrosine autokinase
MNDKNNEPPTIAGVMASGDGADDDKKGYFLPGDSSESELEPTYQEATGVAVERRLRKMNLLVPGSALGRHFSDEYRRIKRPLLANAFGKTASLVEQGNLILITSSLPNEGKTTNAINLALSMAQEKDHTVLLVDCDVNKQGTSKLLGLKNRPGLVELLENDSMNVGDVLLRTDIPELCVLSAGKGGDDVTELLASQRMSDIVAEMASRYDDRVIIFDAPPLLPTPQTQVLAELVGQVVFVIEAGKTPQMLVEEAVDMLPEEKAIGLLLNKTEGISGRSGYYYGYYGSEEQ